MESFNPQILPSSLPKKDHHKASLMALWAAVAAITIGFLYWWIVHPRPQENTPAYVPPPTNEAAQIRSQVHSRISQEPLTETSSEETQKISTKLASPPKTQASAEDRESMNKRMQSMNQ